MRRTRRLHIITLASVQPQTLSSSLAPGWTESWQQEMKLKQQCLISISTNWVYFLSYSWGLCHLKVVCGCYTFDSSLKVVKKAKDSYLVQVQDVYVGMTRSLWQQMCLCECVCVRKTPFQYLKPYYESLLLYNCQFLPNVWKYDGH